MAGMATGMDTNTTHMVISTRERAGEGKGGEERASSIIRATRVAGASTSGNFRCGSLYEAVPARG